ncbi:MAG: hypothetical protein ACFBRM_15400 [Pikeienuella sp.]
MKLSELEWSEPEIGGILKSTHSVALARFVWQGHDMIALEWFRRTGHLFHPYARLVLIAEECDKTTDVGLMRQIAFGARVSEEDGAPRVLASALLGRKVIVIADVQDRNVDLGRALDEII